MRAPTIKTLLADFKRTHLPTRAWLTIRNLRVYVRVTQRCVEGKVYASLDVASAEVPERYRGKGAFTRWMDKTEALAAEHGMIVFAESILERRLIGFFTKRNYQMVGESNPSSMFKLPPATAPSAGH